MQAENAIATIATARLLRRRGCSGNHQWLRQHYSGVGGGDGLQGAVPGLVQAVVIGRRRLYLLGRAALWE